MTILKRSIMKFEPSGELFGHKPDSQILVWMKPSEFLDKAPKLKKEYLESSRFQDSIKGLSEKMKKDEPIDPLFLDIDIENCKTIGHEGRHRSIVAQLLGIARVPVIIYLKDREKNYISVKEYMERGCKCNIFESEKNVR